MDLYEHQGKALLAAAGIPVPPSRLAHSRQEAVLAAPDLGYPVAVKAQVLAGGRGKAGGVRLVDGPVELAQTTEEILRLRISGKPVSAVLLEEGRHILRELYLAIALDRARRCPLLVFSTRGGVDIEQVVGSDPGALLCLPIDPLLGLRDYQVRRVCLTSGLDAPLRQSLAGLLHGLWALYRDNDATLVEINPLVLARRAGTADDSHTELVALDAKITIDDNALPRQPQLDSCAEPANDRERQAKQAGFAYVSLEGEIGVLGNGAGLVMGLLDQIQLAGGRPANFLDVGGGADAQRIATALQIVLSDARVKVLLVNIFGGITRCDEVARGLLAALQRTGASLPIVAALAGTNAEGGRELLEVAAAAQLHVAADAEQAIAAAVALAGEPLAASSVAAAPGRSA